MRFDLLTIFPEFFAGPFDFGIIKRARQQGIIEVGIHDLRSFTFDKHHQVDDRPFGGGEGMVMKPEPVFRAVETLLADRAGRTGETGETEKTDGRRDAVVLLSPQGRPLKQQMARELADEARHVIVICGRYEGVDERVNDALVTDEISIGDYVLTGGELPIMVVLDAVARHLVDPQARLIVTDEFSGLALLFPFHEPKARPHRRGIKCQRKRSARTA